MSFFLLLIFRYKFNGTKEFGILHPCPVTKIGLSHINGQTTINGIEIYTLNIVRNLDALNISFVQTKVSQKHRKYFFILCEDPLLIASDNKFIKLFDDFWERNVLNIAIVYWNHTLTAVTFTPFQQPKLIYIQGNELKNIKDVFKKTSENLYGYPLNVTIFYDSSRAKFNRNKTDNVTALDGTDGLLGRLIVEKMNATLNMTVPEDGQEIGELYRNGSGSGCLGALMSGAADIGFNIRFYRLSQFESRIEATFVNGRDDICFLVPRKGKSTDIANIFRPFDKHAWFAIIATILCYAMAFYLFILFKNNRHKSFIYYFMQFFAYTLQQQVNFTIQTKLQRFLLGIWLMSALLISTMYQSKLSGNLIIPKDAPNYDTFEQLATSDLKILSLERYNRQISEFFRDKKYQGAYEPIIERLVNVSLDELYKKLYEMNSSFGFANKHHINIYLKRKLWKNSEIFYHHVSRCPVPYLGVYGVRYGTPLKHRFNFILRQAQESGLIELWNR